VVSSDEVDPIRFKFDPSSEESESSRFDQRGLVLAAQYFNVDQSCVSSSSLLESNHALSRINKFDFVEMQWSAIS
jgi:hypothetical protein